MFSTRTLPKSTYYLLRNSSDKLSHLANSLQCAIYSLRGLSAGLWSCFPPPSTPCPSIPSEATVPWPDFLLSSLSSTMAVQDRHLTDKVPWYVSPYGHIWKAYILIPTLYSHPWNTFSILLWHLESNITSHTDVSNCVSLCVMDSVFLTNITFLQRLFNHTFNMWSFWLKGHAYKCIHE